MDVNWLFVGMHYVQKKLIRKTQNLFLNFGYFSLFSNVQDLLDSILAVTSVCQTMEKGLKVLLGLLKEKLETSMYVHFGLLCKFLDQMQNYPIQINKVKDWTFRFQKKKKKKKKKMLAK